MPLCGKESVCDCCGGVIGCETPLEKRARKKREEEEKARKQKEEEEEKARKQKEEEEEKARRQEKHSKQSEQTGGDQGDDERDDEDEERDQEEEESDSEEETEEEESDSEEETEEEESDSEEETEEEESKRTGKKKKTKCRRKNESQRSNRQTRGGSEEVDGAALGLADAAAAVSYTRTSRKKRARRGDVAPVISDMRRAQEKARTQLEEEIATSQNPKPEIRFAMINVCSLNKQDRVSELITQNNLDVFLTTETWLRDDNADRVLRDAAPEGYRFHSQVRAGRRGGGVAILFSEKLQGERLLFNDLNITTFEFVVTKLTHNGQDVAIIGLYLPPGYNRQRFGTFMGEFKLLLSEVQEKCSRVIVAGDLNMPEGKGETCYTDEFHIYMMKKCRWENDFAEERTHRGGNTLDEVFGINVEISGLEVRDDGISDHSTVYFNAKPKDTKKKTKADDNKDRKRFKKTKE